MKGRRERFFEIGTRLQEAGLWIIAGAVPLAWTDSLQAEYVLPKVVLLSLALTLSSAGAVLAAWTRDRGTAGTPLDLPLLVCGAALALSTVFSAAPISSALGQYNSHAYGLWGGVLCAAVYYLTVWGEDPARDRRVVRVCLASAALVGLYALLQSAGFELFARTAKPRDGRAMSTIGGPVFLGGYLALLFPLSLHMAFDDVKAGSARFVPAAAVAAGLWASIARGSWLGGLAGAGLYLVLAHGGKARRLTRRSWFLAACAAAVVGALLLSRMAARETPVWEGPRLEVWRAAWTTFKEAPLLGTGPDTFELGFRRHRRIEFIRYAGKVVFQVHAHNDVLQAMATTGLLGTAAYLLLLVTVVRCLLRGLADPGRRGLSAACFASLAALFVHMKFNPVTLETLVLAGALAGLLVREDRAKTAGGFRWPALLVLVFAAGSVLLSARLAAADLEFKRGRAWIKAGDNDRAYRHLRKAVSLSPCELEYLRTTVNHLIETAYADPSSGVAIEYFDYAARYGERALACHPNDMHSHYILGVASLMQAQAGVPGRLEVAERELDAALPLDPYYWPLIRARLRAAIVRGDKAAAAEMKERTRLMDAWHPAGPDPFEGLLRD